MKRIAVILFIAGSVIIFSTGCATYPVISKHDFKDQSDEVLRDRLLKLTPIGTDKAQVLDVISSKLKREARITHRINYPGIKYEFSSGEPKIDDKIISSHLAFYDRARGWFITGRVVSGYWWIDKSDKLIDIKVKHWRDGP